jgi:transposase
MFRRTILENLFLKGVLNVSYITRAIHYNLKQWHKLSRYVDDGHLGIDNNITERDIRPFTTGRKNW